MEMVNGIHAQPRGGREAAPSTFLVTCKQMAAQIGYLRSIWGDDADISLVYATRQQACYHFSHDTSLTITCLDALLYPWLAPRIKKHQRQTSIKRTCNPGFFAIDAGARRAKCQYAVSNCWMRVQFSSVESMRGEL